MVKINKNITLDELAEMVARGFSEVDGRLDRMEKDIAEIKKEVGLIKFELDEIKERLDYFEDHVVLDLQKRVKILEHTVKALSLKLEAK